MSTLKLNHRPTQHVTIPNYFDGFADLYTQLSDNGFFEDHALFHKLLKPFLPSRSKILIIGIASGGKAEPFAKDNHEIHGIDFSKEMLERAQRKEIANAWHLHSIDVTQAPIPYADHTFDAVISNGIVSYIPDAHFHVAEMNRVLKPQGRLSLSFIPSASNKAQCIMTDVTGHDQSTPQCTQMIEMHHHPIAGITDIVNTACSRLPKTNKSYLEYTKINGEQVHFQYQLY